MAQRTTRQALAVTAPSAVVANAEAFYERHRVRMIYEGSDGEATQALYTELAGYGAIGLVAVNLFRAQKCSARAKIYRSGHYSTLAYGRKNWSLEQLAAILGTTAGLGFTWGWGDDAQNQPRYPWVLYVDLPQGQVSFHSGVRGVGPDYSGSWDGVEDASAERIIAFVDSILHPARLEPVASAPVESQPHDQARRVRRIGARRRVSRAKSRR